MKGLTGKQKEVLEYIERYGQEQGMSPTINEISSGMGITAATAFCHVKALQKKGRSTAPRRPGAFQSPVCRGCTISP